MSGDGPDPFLLRYEARLQALRYEAVGFLEALIISPRPSQHDLVPFLEVLPETGPVGQYPGKQWWRGKRIPGRQISAVNAEVLDALDIPYAVPGDNLIVRGFDLAGLAPGDVLRVGDALLVATTTPHRPCSKFARRTSLAKMQAISKGQFRGVLLDARAPATLHVGDPVERIFCDGLEEPTSCPARIARNEHDYSHENSAAGD